MKKMLCLRSSFSSKRGDYYLGYDLIDGDYKINQIK